jgi:hypothetical protein
MTKLVILVSVCAVGALFWWIHHRPIRRTRPEVIDLIKRALITGGDPAWDEFVSVKILDPELEAVRQKCSSVTLEPKQTFDKTLRQILGELQTSD